jgi:hypothetical protein
MKTNKFDGNSYASDESAARYKERFNRYNVDKIWAVLVVDKTTPEYHKVSISEHLNYGDANRTASKTPNAKVITMQQVEEMKALYGLKPLQ